MKCYPNLFAYLNGENEVSESEVLHPRDRAILSLDFAKDLSTSYPLIPQGNGIYEIAFPYLRVADLEHHHHQLHYVWGLEFENQTISLTISDEVLDAGGIEETSQLEEWKDELGEKLDLSVAVALQSFTGLCEAVLSEREGRYSKTNVIQLLEKISAFQVADATQPLVVSLNNRYKLDKNLQVIAPKLRQQLRRKSELMPVGSIQEMDAYCLRDYTRRPGRNAAEKAGSRQELMGVRRYQDYNTPENRFLIYFAGRLLYRECLSYRNQDEIDRFEKTIRRFRQQATVQPILKKLRRFQFTKPNYVLLQNPIYNSFYRAYLDFIAKRSEKERVWGYRNALLKDVIYFCLTAALMRFSNSHLDALSSFRGLTSPEKGNYLREVTPSPLRVFLQNKVYLFQLKQPSHINLGDWLLTVEVQDLNSNSLEVKEIYIPIWVFWYLPSDVAIREATSYLQKLQKEDYIKTGIIFYLQEPASSVSASGRTTSVANQQLHLFQIPDCITNDSFLPTINLIVCFLQKVIE